MPQKIFRPAGPALCLAMLIGALPACSRTAGSDGATSTTSPPAVSAPPIPAGTVCDRKLLTADDLAGIFDEPITGTKPLQGDAQTCYFTTTKSNELRVTLRPGNGRAVIGSFTSGRMNEYAKWQLLAGVGEEAVWKPDLTEVSARNGDVLCEIAPEAGSLFLAQALKAADETVKQQKLGGLCNTIFARLHLAGATAARIGKSAGGNAVETACEKDVTQDNVDGMQVITKVRGEDLAKKLGALCGKVFAAR